MATASGASETGKVIHDYECKEYKEGWQSCNEGRHYLSNPYGSLAYEGELYRLWQKGYNDCQQLWNSSSKIPYEISQSEINASFTITDPKNHLPI